MRVNIENCLRNAVRSNGSDKKGYAFVIEEIIGHLKELKERTSTGDMTALTEFFDLYVFNEEKNENTKEN